MDEQPSLDSLLAYQPLIQSTPFLSGIVHDINNGVGAVIAYAELIGMGSHSRAELDDMLEDLVSASRRVADLNEGLSMLTRLETQKRAAASVGKLIGQVVLVCEYRFRTLGVRLDVSLDGDLERTLECYRNELSRAIVYLLLNALENSFEAPRKEVSLAAIVDGAGLAVRIRDRGPVMTPEEYERALAPYYTTKEPPHLGLGLTAARAIAELHGGTLTYSAETGVTLAFPHPTG